MFRRAWGRAPVPVSVLDIGGHNWFYRRNKNLLRLSIKSALIVTDNSKTSNSRARVALMGAKTTVTMPYYARIVLEYI